MALAMRPRIFLMDEPMAGLGHEGLGRLIGFLDKLSTEAPILLIEHDMDAVFQLADRISVLVSGQDHRPRHRRRDPQPSGSAHRLSRGGRGMSLLEVQGSKPSMAPRRRCSASILKSPRANWWH
jgi:energy-coupling factor transporter ATP-binding protein EcfA2